ncbi:MAG: carboxymuconolactone decarboxylase family protein [Dehalococcoidales bacterium]|nr:MAG: carboxymuconolactone decarboxylase family protein [Dehalococcoidales bacterium]
MGSIKLIPEEEATGRVKEIFEEIKEKLGIDFVPNLYRAMAPIPEYLETQWNKTKAIMQRPGKLDKLTREIIAVAVSTVNGCRY